MLGFRKPPWITAISKCYYGTTTRPHLLSSEIRRRHLDYFTAENDHQFVKSSPVVPFCDPTVPFVNAGMVQFKNILLDKMQPQWKRVANSQKCIRVNDLSVVGSDGYHHTFFEMLGNWSFNDYGKEDACRLSWNLLTGPYNIHPSRLYVTYFAGDPKSGLTPDLECLEIWRKLGIAKDRILPFGMQDNFWVMGTTGPSGPCTEIHIDHLPNSDPTRRAQFVNAGLPDLTELWNIVFIEYNRNVDGSLTELPQKHIDTGMGFERLVAVLQGQSCNYSTDLFMPIFNKIASTTKAPPYRGCYDLNSESYDLDRDYRILVDHVRMIATCIADGVYPNFNARLRQVLRKSISLCDNTFKHPHLLETVVLPMIVDSLGHTYGELELNFEKIQQVIAYEDEMYKELLKATTRSFSKMRLNGITIEDVIDYPGFIAGYKNLEKMLRRTDNANAMTGDIMYELHKSNGLSEEILLKMADLKRLTPDLDGFRKQMEEAKQKKRAQLALRNKSHHGECFGTLPATDDTFKYKYHFDAAKKTYEIPLVRGTVLAIDKVAKKDNLFHVVTDRSNFYSFAGGQASDAGQITSSGGAIFQVTDVSTTDNGVVIHTGHLVSGQLNKGDSVELTVDQNRRTTTTLHHSATHLLQAAVKHVTKHIVYQISSDVSAERLSFDIGILGPKPTDTEIVHIEQCVRNAINQATPIETIAMTTHDLYACENVTLIPGIVYDQDAITVLRIQSNEVVSIEPCCGTHARNTRELQEFHITVFRGNRGRGLFTIEAVCGDIAKKVAQSGEKLFAEIQEMRQIWKKVDGEDASNLENRVRKLHLDCVHSIIPMTYLQREAALDALKVLEKQLDVKNKAAVKSK